MMTTNTMKLKVLLVILMLSAVSWGQTTVTVGGGASVTCPATPTATWTTPPAGITFSNWSRGSGVTCGTASNAISGSVFNAANAAAGFTANRFYSVTLTANASTPFTLNSLLWITQLSGSTNSCNFTVQYSNNGGALTTFGTAGQSITSSGAQTNFTFNGSVSVAASTSIVIYLIPHQATASGTTVRWINGSTITVTPNPAASAPTVTSSAATSIGTTSATLNGNVTSDGGSAVTDRGFVYKTTAGVTIADNKTTVAGTTGAFTLSPTLTVNTQYFFRSYAINGIGTTLSTPELSFFTLANVPSAPTVNNATATTLDVAITSGDGNPATTTYAIQTGALFVQADGTLGASAVYQTASAWGTRTVSGLTSATLYNFTAIARNGAGTSTSASGTGSGTTLTPSTPSLAITGTTAHGASCPTIPTASITYTITNSGLAPAAGVTVVSNDAQFVVSGLSSTTIAASGGTATYVVTFTPSSSGAQTATITVASTTSGSNSPTSALTGTGTTAVTQAVTSSAATAIAATTATLNGNVTTLGVCPASASKGFVYSLTSTNNDPLNGGTGVTTTGVAGIATGAYTLGLTGLTAGVNYTFKAYVFNGTTYTYGATLNFTTLGVPVVTAASLSGAIGVAFSYSIVATNSPTSYAVASGTLPAGLSLNTTTGAITGTPTTAGSSSVTVTATNGAGTSAAATISFSIASGPCLTENFTSGTQPSGWIDSDAGSSITYSSNLADLAIATGSITTLAIANPTSMTFDLSRTTNATAKNLNIEVSTTSQSSGFTVVTNYDHANTVSGGTTACTVDLSAYTSFSTVYVRFNKTSGTTSPWRIDNINVFCSTSLITLTPSTLTAFTYNFGSGPSSNQTFTASGTDLTNNILLTPPTNYEISTAAGSGFGSTITLTQSGGVVPATTIYVRLKAGLAVGNYNAENVVATSTGAATKNVTCSGNVVSGTPTITLSTSTLTGFVYLLGSGPSSNQTFTASGTNLTTDLVLTPPTNFEISLAAGSGFGSTITLTPSGGTVSSTTIYVRLASGLSAGSYNSQLVTATSTGATSQNVSCSGSVISSSSCLNSNFDGSTSVPSGWGGSSTNDSVTSHLQSSSNCRALASGQDLITTAVDNPVSIDFYVDASGSGGQVGTLQYRIGAGAWTSIGTFTATTVGATVTFPLTSSPNLSATAAVSFRLSSASSTIYIDDLNAYCNTVGGPLITVTPTTLTGFSYIFGSGPSANQTFTAAGSNLTADILLTPPTNYEISLDAGTGFGSTITLPQTGGVVNATTIYVRLKVGLSVGSYNSQNVVASSTGATSRNVTCSGTVSSSSNSITSDIIAVASTESATISSLENDAAITTVTDGAQVWRFTIRDGGTVVDADALATIVNSITLTQNAGNTINDWSDAIEAVALFDGSTKIAEGVITATSITFTGAPLITVPDNTSLTLSVRLSIQINPNNSGGNLDGDDFVFTVDHANLTESSAGSQFKSSGTVSSTNGQNVLAIVATQFVYTQQPTNTGQSATMSSVRLTATDANGNKDLGYTGVVSLTSTGTMTGSPLTATSIAGVATFSTIIHTVLATGLTLTATAAGIATAVSPAFDITPNTTFQPGDLAILAVNTRAAASGSADEISFVSFIDVLPGTTFYLTDNGYERVFAGQWGNTEGTISITRTGTTLPKGTIVTLQTVDGGVNDGTDFTLYSCGVVDTNWTKGVASPSTYFFDLNKNDQVWITQGGTWGNTATAAHNMTYNGNVLYGWTDIPWKTAINYASTQGSTVVPQRECYATDVANPETGAAQVKFNDPVNPDFSTLTNGKLDWIALINNPANWNYYTSDANYDAGGYNYLGSTTCPTLTIATDTYVNGRWVGSKDTNWFNCGNWDTLVVPDETVDVTIPDTTFNREANISATETNAAFYGGIALAKSLTISGEKVQIIANSNNKLEVRGNLSISGSGVLDMDDSNSGTSDGQLYLYGNWTNSAGSVAFHEGNGTVHFLGSTTQVIGNVTPDGTETFFNVIMDNNFNTQASNNLIATGDLTLNANKTLTINVNDYVQVNRNFVNNGTVSIKNSGQLIQVDDAGVNSGTGAFSLERTATVARTTDYVYWSSPVPNFQVGNVSVSSWLRYKWLPTVTRSYASNFGGWQATPATEVMELGKGYIIRGPYTVPTATFTNTVPNNLPNNGSIPVAVERSTYNGADYTYNIGTTVLTVGRDNDNYNLLGNPYPSAVDVKKFLALNTNLVDGVRLWTHGTAIGSGNGQSFYNSFAYSYSATDYMTATVMGASTGPGDYAIASGQGFFVTFSNGSASPTENVIFNNSMRSDVAAGVRYNNSVFYRKANNDANKRSRIWLDIIDDSGTSVRTLVGYMPEATLRRDRLFDARLNVDTNLNIFSLIKDEPQIIQGRPTPLNQEDRVPIGVVLRSKGGNTAPSTNTYTIAIAFIDGVFENKDQDIYLEDKQLNIIHNLKLNPYIFKSESGRYDNRFVLRYTPSNNSLGTNPFSELDNTVVVSSNSSEIKIKSFSDPLKKVTIYDLLGRKMYTNNNSTHEISIQSIVSRQQVLIVKMTLENGQTVTKKIVH